VRYTFHLLLVPVLAAAGFLSYGLATAPDVARLAKANPNTTVLIEARLAEAAEKGRPFTLSWTWVPLTSISPHLQRAVIVAEDWSFYQHHGFDWEGLQEAFTRNWEQGRLRRGGSTITQQLAKNLYLSSEKSLLRKAREALIALEIERCLSKQRILELYLNVAEWGHGVFGAEAAARHHFEKSADELTEEEAALLAALLPSPRRHDPIRHPSLLTKRQEEILYWMHRKNGNHRPTAASPNPLTNATDSPLSTVEGSQ
jgi:monofunctional biosynthetic peptidoglycan transglycosylase